MKTITPMPFFHNRRKFYEAVGLGAEELDALYDRKLEDVFDEFVKNPTPKNLRLCSTLFYSHLAGRCNQLRRAPFRLPFAGLAVLLGEILQTGLGSNSKSVEVVERFLLSLWTHLDQKQFRDCVQGMLNILKSTSTDLAVGHILHRILTSRQEGELPDRTSIH